MTREHQVQEPNQKESRKITSAHGLMEKSLIHREFISKHVDVVVALTTRR